LKKCFLSIVLSFKSSWGNGCLGRRPKGCRPGRSQRFPFVLTCRSGNHRAYQKFFRDLPRPLQNKIHNTAIRTITINAHRNSDLRYEVFERLNRGSMALNEQELRNCVYRGPFNDLLAELEKDIWWRRVKGGDDPAAQQSPAARRCAILSAGSTGGIEQ
jgi:hypothetical protein